VGLSRRRIFTVGSQNYEAEVRKTLTDPENIRPDAEILLSELHPSVAIRSGTPGRFSCAFAQRDSANADSSLLAVRSERLSECSTAWARPQRANSRAVGQRNYFSSAAEVSLNFFARSLYDPRVITCWNWAP